MGPLGPVPQTHMQQSMQTPVKERVHSECWSSDPPAWHLTEYVKVLGGDMSMSRKVQVLWSTLAAAQEAVIEIPHGPSPTERSHYGLIRDIVEYHRGEHPALSMPGQFSHNFRLSYCEETRFNLLKALLWISSDLQLAREFGSGQLFELCWGKGNTAREASAAR